MSIASLPFFVAMALILISTRYMDLGLKTWNDDRKSRMRQLYFATCACLGLWSANFGFMTIVASPGFVRFFWSVGFFASCLMFPFWMHFLLLVTGFKVPSRTVFLAPFYVASFLLAVLGVFTEGVTFVHTDWGNQYLYSGFWQRAALVFIFVQVLVFLVMLVHWFRAPKPKRIHREARIFLVATLFTAVPGYAFDFVLPGFLGINHPPVSTICMFVLAYVLYRTMRAYKGLDITVEHAATIIFHAINVPALLLHPDNRVAMVNRAAEEFWNQPDGLIGHRVSELITVDGARPEDALFNEDRAALSVEVESSLGPRSCNAQVFIILDEYGEVFYKVAVFIDVTAMHNALALARSASEAKSEFLSRMSHEIRTPLHAVISMVHIARQAVCAGDTGKALDSLDHAGLASTHLHTLINDVLDMAKIEAGKLVITADPFALRASMHEVSSIVEQQCRDKDIQFHTNLDSLPDVWLYGEKLRIKQILINILGNSVKFTAKGGNISLLADAVEDDGVMRLLFTITDDGIGMAPEFLERVFDPFEQADTTACAGGTGLGLPISKTIATLMGGDISVESKLGVGSTFRFFMELPITKAQQEACEQAEERYDFSDKRLLVAEDIEINRMILEELLMDTGIIIEVAEDGRCALDKYMESPDDYYSMILMDIKMPNMDGYEATRRIRALPRTDAATVPIVAMSANAYLEDIAKSKEAGMDDHLAKPIDMRLVLRTLAKHLGQGVPIT